ncbi:MAG: hypothetical protein IJ562_03250 [Prevotella sp.]|nr:hypothetical protein [Prevotella sp.]
MNSFIKNVNSTAAMKAVCAIVFCITVFLYTCFAQADMLAYVWQQLFGSVTGFHSVPVSLLITAFAAFVLYIIYKVCLRRISWNLHTFWICLLTICIILSVSMSLTDTSDVHHYRLRTERLLLDGKTDRALLVGKKSRTTNRDLVMLRAYALEKNHQLGDKLFQYPMVKGGSAILYPDSSTEQRFLPLEQIRRLAEDKQSVDYRLCGLLLDKQLDAFAKSVTKYYDVSSPTLPKHYKEALTLYTHKRSNRVITYYDSVVDADYEDFLKLVNGSSKDISQTSARDVYGNTYWYYYVYQ